MNTGDHKKISPNFFMVCLQPNAWLESYDHNGSFGTKISGSLIVSPVLWVLSSRNTLSVTHSNTASYISFLVLLLFFFLTKWWSLLRRVSYQQGYPVQLLILFSISELFIQGWECTSNSEYLVRNPVQAALQSNKSLKARHFFEYFWFGMTLRPKGSRNLFQICSKSTHDWLMDIFILFMKIEMKSFSRLGSKHQQKQFWRPFSSCIS